MENSVDGVVRNKPRRDKDVAEYFELGPMDAS